MSTPQDVFAQPGEVSFAAGEIAVHTPHPVADITGFITRRQMIFSGLAALVGIASTALWWKWNRSASQKRKAKRDRNPNRLDKVRRDIPLAGRIHLNAAGASPCPVPVLAKQLEVLNREQAVGGYVAATEYVQARIPQQGCTPCGTPVGTPLLLTPSHPAYSMWC